MEILTTPDRHFEALPGPDFESHTTDIGDGLAVHHVEAGVGPVVILMHGQPTWSFLYRSMIGRLTDEGYRVIAPDLVGFGRSSKPSEMADHTYERHVTWMTRWLDALDPDGVTLFAQDWGGLIGLRVATNDPARFDRIAIGNTGLPVGRSIGPGFDRWLQTSQTMEVMDAGAMLQFATRARELTDAEMDAYRAPFPSELFMAGAREFPTLVPITPEHGGVAENLAAWEALERWTKPFVTMWGLDDAVLGHLGSEFVARVPGAAGQPHVELSPCGHFVQDDRGEDIAAALVEWMS